MSLWRHLGGIERAPRPRRRPRPGSGPPRRRRRWWSRRGPSWSTRPRWSRCRRVVLGRGRAADEPVPRPRPPASSGDDGDSVAARSVGGGHGRGLGGRRDGRGGADRTLPACARPWSAREHDDPVGVDPHRHSLPSRRRGRRRHVGPQRRRCRRCRGRGWCGRPGTCAHGRPLAHRPPAIEDHAVGTDHDGRPPRSDGGDGELAPRGRRPVRATRSPATRLVSPSSSATRRETGAAHTSAGGPACSDPALRRSRTMRSASANASAWSWVTATTVSAVLGEEAPELVDEALPQGAVERTERLVEEQHRRRRRQRPGQGDALLLAARQLGHRTRPRSRQADERRAARRPRAAMAVARPPLHPEPEADVAGDVAVREQRVVLEHQADAASVHGDAVPGRDRRSRTVPASSGCRPATARSSVDLPRAARPEHGHHLAGRRPRGRRRRARGRAEAPRVAPRTAKRGAAHSQPPGPGRTRSVRTRSTSEHRRGRAHQQDRAERERLARVEQRPGGRAGGRSRRAPWARRRGRSRSWRRTRRARSRTRTRRTPAPPAARAGGRPRATPAAGDAPSTAAASRRRSSIERSTGVIVRTTNGQRHDGLRQRHEPRAGPQVDRLRRAR